VLFGFRLIQKRIFIVKEIEYSVPLPLKESWQKTQEFWQVQKKARIKQAEITAGNEKGVMEIIQNPSFTSFGQRYLMEFSTVNESITSVHVRIWLNWGSGLQWAKANTTLKDWARVVGTTYQNFAKRDIVVGIVVVTIAIIIVIIVFLYSYRLGYGGLGFGGPHF